MDIYEGKTPHVTNYRRIYKKYYGIIPKDDLGRTYEIHHKDGNNQNNDPNNLIALSIQEHYDIHYSQGDWGACLFIAQNRLNKSAKEISELARKNVQKQIENGTFHGSGKNNHRFNHTYYKWENLDTKETVSLRISDMAKLTNTKSSVWGSVVRGDLESYKRWRLYNDSEYRGRIKTRGDGHYSYNDTVYTWEHKITGEIISDTLYNMRTRFNSSNFWSVVKGTMKSCKGWKLVKR